MVKTCYMICFILSHGMLSFEYPEVLCILYCMFYYSIIFCVSINMKISDNIHLNVYLSDLFHMYST